MISTIYVHRVKDDPKAEVLLHHFTAEGYHSLQNLIIEKVFRFEGIHTKEAFQLKPLLCHPETEEIAAHSVLDEKNGPVFEVGYQRAVTDPELPSILRGSEDLGVSGIEWVRIAHRYQFKGIDTTQAEEIVKRYLYNPQVETIIKSGEEWDTLKPVGSTGPVTKVDLRGLTREQLIRLSEERRLFLDADNMLRIQEIENRMGRLLTDGELEMFAQTWSDHCFHTTWKSLGLLEMLNKATVKIDHPLVISVFEDNAGAVEFYDGWAITVKGETHNSPTAISPYGGIMTKHGGVIRDTLGCGQGAWPIGGSTVMGIGDPRTMWEDLPKGVLHPKTILAEAIKGTADYTNPMGIPMMFPKYRFHPDYIGKCFALGHSVGLIPASRAKKGHPELGDIAVLIGGKTGRDGIHGATVSSGSMTSDTATVDAAHVQIGHPIEERKFMEAIPVLRDNKCLRAITDLGAAGLSSAAGEMGQESGVWINLAKVPLKTEGMYPWEIWISESQERMLLCVPAEKKEETLEILQRYEVPSAVIGKFTESKRCQVVYDPEQEREPEDLPVTPDLQGEVLIDLDYKDLRKGCKLPGISVQEPESEHHTFTPPAIENENDFKTAVTNILSHLNICDQSAAGTQFDTTVQGRTVIEPYGDKKNYMPHDVWVSAPLRGKRYGCAVSLGYNPFYGEIAPGRAGKLIMVEAISKLITVGVNYKDIVLCDNFYTPRINSEVAWILTKMVTECCNLSVQLGTPFISGKDSSSGTYVGPDGKRIDIPPTLAVLALGRLKNVNKIIPKSWQRAGDKLLFAGPLSTELGGSVYFDTFDQRGTDLPEVNPKFLIKFWKKINSLQKNGLIKSSSALEQGGLIVKLFEMAMGSGLGCEINLKNIMSNMNANRLENVLFSEMIGSLILEVDKDSADIVIQELDCLELGQIINGSHLNFDTDKFSAHFSLSELIEVWKKPFPNLLNL
ncbi:MAG: AIR synthase-related protein [bacterium]